MSGVAIRLQQIGKRFRVARQPSHSLKEATIRFLRRELVYDDFVALDGVTFSVQPGEAVGIIGPNGSGKSTLFKIISGVLRPTSGELEVHGRISPLIELSAGFHPELTGIENIYLNGGIYGMRRREVTAKLDAITAFADIGDFLYSPVRVYSSGMMARLAFAVAINVDADVLLLDEVLAVGDAQFQERCSGAICGLKARGMTVVYVSHDMRSIVRLTDRVLLLERGVVRADGAPRPVIEQYLGLEHARRIFVDAGGEASVPAPRDGSR
jgi:ABC-type polysaccharide/polyol phosphate transport system ATPase subunit